MKKLMFAAGVAAVASCASAESSFFGNLFSSGTNETVTSSEVQSDTGIAELNQQIMDLTALIESAKNMPQQKRDELEAKRESFKKQLKAKVDKAKKERKAKIEAEKTKIEAKIEAENAKIEAEKAKVEETKKSGEGLINSVKGLFN